MNKLVSMLAFMLIAMAVTARDVEIKPQYFLDEHNHYILQCSGGTLIPGGRTYHCIDSCRAEGFEWAHDITDFRCSFFGHSCACRNAGR